MRTRRKRRTLVGSQRQRAFRERHPYLRDLLRDERSKENLVGGETYRECSGETDSPSKSKQSTSGRAEPTSTDGERLNDGATDVVFTKDEKDDNDALLVSASADGDLEERGVNLYLTETKRFSGVYQGHLRLTDANGDGRGKTN